MIIVVLLTSTGKTIYAVHYFNMVNRTDIYMYAQNRFVPYFV